MWSGFGEGVARANGVFPAVSQLVVEPGEPTHLYLRTTFGVVFSLDNGASWSWICEDALGYTNTLPPIAVLEGGELVIGVPTGVSHGKVSECGFKRSTGIDANVVDLAVVKKTPNAMVALGIDYTTHATQVYESTDSGASFAAIGPSFPGFLGTTIDVAPGDPDVIYVSGMPTSGSGGLLLRSTDHGVSFEPHSIPDSVGQQWPYIGAIDAENSNRVFVRLAEVPGRLKVTTDGGETFSEPLRLDDALQGFALSPDGKSVFVSSPARGTFRADSTALEFEQLACSGVSCLKWNGDVLYACGDQTIDGYTVGRSLDQGKSYERLLNFECITPYAECPGSSPVSTICPPLWPFIQMQLMGFGECGADMPAPPVFDQCLGSGGSGGNPGADGAGRAGGGAASGGSSGSASGGKMSSKKGGGGCGCHVAGAPRGASFALLFGVAALAGGVTLRRFRKRRSAARRSRDAGYGSKP
jgi:hypothetical protein